MTSPLVLIAIPTFNRSHTIISTIKSICEQTYKNWELVVIDNCSNDETERLIRKNFSNEKRINYAYYNHHVPLHINWKRAYEFINPKKYKYFKYLCSDDILKKNFLEKAIHALEKTNANIFAYTSNIVYVKNNMIIKNRRYGFFKYEKVASLYLKNYLGCPSAMLLKTKNMIFFDENPFFIYAGDIYESLNYYVQKRKIIFSNDYLVCFQLSEHDSETNRMFGTHTMIHDKKKMRDTILPKLYSGLRLKIAFFFSSLFYYLEKIFFWSYKILNKN